MTNSVIRSRVRSMTAYRPPLEGRSESGALLLDFNERTVPLPRTIIEALHRTCDQNSFHLYPEYHGLDEAIARYAQVPSSQVLFTNGSDHGIELVYRSVTEPGDEAIVPAPTFAMLRHCAEVSGLVVHEPHITRESGYPLDEVLRLVNGKTRLIVVCNPNSPTGTLTERDTILTLAAHAPQAAILVDECYFEYAGVTVKDSLDAFENIFITRTFSKTWGFAGLRLGYVLSAAQNIEDLSKVRGPYDINKCAIAAALAALEDPSYMIDYCKEVTEISRPLLVSFLEEKGVLYWPTASNFILIHSPADRNLEQNLKERRILVRPRNGPGINRTIRISIGTSLETERLITVLREILD